MVVATTTATVHPLRAQRLRQRLSRPRLAAATGLSSRTILRAEHGEGVNPATVQILCSFFRRTPEELGLVLRHGPQGGGDGGPVSSRPGLGTPGDTFIGGGATAAADGETLDDPDPLVPPGLLAAARIEPDVAAPLRRVLAEYAAIDNLVGPGQLLPLLPGQLALLEELLRRVDGDARAELLDVAARGAEFLGWLYQDAGDLARASVWSGRALDYALQLVQPGADAPTVGAIRHGAASLGRST
jgi:hypothetical protein